MPTDWSEDFIPGEYATGEAACDDEEDEESGVEDDSESMLTELSSLQQDDCLPTLSTNGDEKLKRLAMQFIQAAEQEVVEKQKNPTTLRNQVWCSPNLSLGANPSNLFCFKVLNSIWSRTLESSLVIRC